MQEMSKELRAEFDALLETRQRFERLLANLPGMAYRCRNDSDWTMEFVSDGCRELTGCAPEELIGSSLRSFGRAIHPDDREGVWQGVQEAVRERRAFELTYRIFTATGEEKWVWEQGQGVFDSEGEVEALEGLIVDLTWHRRTEEALRHSEARYRTLAETAQDFIFIIGPDDTVQYVNTYGASMLGLKAEDVIGRRHSEFVPADVGRRQGENLREVLETGQPLRADEFRQFMGHDVSLETHLTPLKDDEGRVTAVLGVARDVTQRRCAEEALRASEQRYRTLAETAQDLIFIVGPDDVVQYVNTHAAAVLGLRVEDLIGKPHSEFAPADVARRQRENQRRVFETGEPLRVEAPVPVAGRDLWLETHLTPLKDDEGRTTAVLGVSRDVTERRRSEEAQRLAAVGELAAGVAHEFNNLLASMSLAAEFSLGGGTLHDHRRLSEVVLQASDRGASI